MTVADARTAAWLFNRLDNTNRMLMALHGAEKFLQMV